MTRLRPTLASMLVAPLLLVGCAPTASQLMGQPPGRATLPELQTRLYETPDEGKILAICIALLQDMGFQIDEAALTWPSLPDLRNNNFQLR